MSLLDTLLPEPPTLVVDWPAIREAFAWVRAMEGCPQDPIHHAEGDVAIHTRMVAEALVADPEWQAMARPGRQTLFWAALLHDVAKPATTRRDGDGRVSAPGHSRRGQIMARRILWRLGMAFSLREETCHLVTHHQMPLYLIERRAPERRLHAISYQTRCDRLAALARADVAGRRCPDAARLLDNIALFTELAREEGCLAAPKAFASDHSRFVYFRREGRASDYEAFDDTRCEATLLSGLPGAGKDTWIASHAGAAEVISLDALRSEMGVEPTEAQGPVVAAARERAKQALRAGRPLVWNGTNLGRERRTGVIGLLADYGARVRVVYCEAAEGEIARRNRARPAPVPDVAIERMLDHWQPPDLTECHALETVLG